MLLFMNLDQFLGSANKFQLASIKSISPPYPLVGANEILKDK
jgi:hypothetical protein